MENSTRRLATICLAFNTLLLGAGCGGGSSKPHAPVIDSLGPTSGIVTTPVTIVGKHFGSTQGTSTVAIGGVEVTPSSWSATTISFDVPDTLYPSTVDVVVTVGGRSSNAKTFDVVLPRTAYVKLDTGTDDAVSAFSIADDGTPTELSGSPYATGDTPSGYGGDASSVTVNRVTRRVFSTSNSTVAVFDIDPVTGELTAVSGSPFDAGGSTSYGIRVNAAGTRAFVANCDTGTVSVLDVAADGSLTPADGSPFTVGDGCPDTPQLLHDDALLSVTDEVSNLYTFTVAADTGALTLVDGTPVALGFREWNSRADPSGTWLYLVNPNDGGLHVFAFDATSGAPSEIDGSPFASGSTGGNPSGITFAPDGLHAYVGNFSMGEIVGFSVSSGVPTAVTGSPFTVGGTDAMTSLAVTRDGSLLVATDETDQSLSVFTIAADGSITPVPGSPFAGDIGSASGLAIGE